MTLSSVHESPPKKILNVIVFPTAIKCTILIIFQIESTAQQHPSLFKKRNCGTLVQIIAKFGALSPQKIP
jgi:hypothetical protein